EAHRTTILGFLLFLFTNFINLYFLTKWKIMTQGEHFWLRSVGSSSIAITLYALLAPIIIVGYKNISSLYLIPSFIFWSFCIKITYILLLAFPASIVVAFLKKQEGMALIEPEINFMNLVFK